MNLTLNHNDDERARRAIEEMDLDREATGAARTLALLIIAAGVLSGVAAFVYVVKLLSH